MDIQKQLGKRIQELRKSKGISQEKLAEGVNIAINTMSNIERGNSFMTAVTLEKIINILDVTPRELFTFEDNANREDLYDYISLKIRLIKNDVKKLDILKKFLDAII